MSHIQTVILSGMRRIECWKMDVKAEQKKMLLEAEQQPVT